MGLEIIKVDVIHKETIKPSSPTPHHLRTTSLSVFDQFQPEIYIPPLIFYPGNTSNNEVNIDRNSLFSERCNRLKTSLSQALTHYYPFAGELDRNKSIICNNDHGAAFLEAQVNCPMSKVLDNPDFRLLEQMLPTNGDTTLADTGYLLLVQINLFQCGGLAIAVSLLHKVADADTLNTFVKCWATISRGLVSTTTADHVVLPPKFGVAASLFPPEDFFNSSQFSLPLPMENCITRKFVFDASKIAALKSKAASPTVPNPSRVEVVSALIWKCMIQASRSNSGVIKPSLWCPMVNMRQRPGKAFGENILGNFVWVFAAMSMEKEVEFESLVAKLRKGIAEYKEKYPNGVSSEHILQSFKQSGNRGKLESYTCSSWCRLSFYETDFGWGKPLWVTTRSAVKNTIMLMDMKDGVGLEASLTLEKEDMPFIESSKELLAYASPVNPTVI